VNRRRKLLKAFGLCALAAPLGVFAQQAKVWRIGFLDGGSRPRPSDDAGYHAAFLRGMRELGHVEGKAYFIEWRFAEGKLERVADFAEELVRLQVDIIVASGGNAALAARKATKTIPIVVAAASDVVGTGLVASLARPGTNVTGLTTVAAELSGKRLELVKEVLPGISLVAVLLNPDEPGSESALREMRAASRALGIELESFSVRAPDDFDKAFSALSKRRAGALVTIRGAVTNSLEKRIVGFAEKTRLPVVSSRSGFAEAGGLMFYGASDYDLFRRAATYVDKILKGAKPGDLPIEQPTKFELVINMKTAKALGIKIPRSILVRADKVIE